MPTVLKTVVPQGTVGSNPTASSIQKLLNEKILELPEEVRHCFDDCLLIGGAIVSLIRQEPINDFDICLTHKKSIILREYFREINGPLLTLTGNMQITYFTKEEFLTGKYVPTFVHSGVYYDFKDDKLYVTQEQLDCISTKTLKISNPDYRQAYMNKFIERGWKVHDQ